MTSLAGAFRHEKRSVSHTTGPHLGRTGFLLVLGVLVSVACATSFPPGKFDGSLYLNEAAGYAFLVPTGWSPGDPPKIDDRTPAEQKKPKEALEFTLRRSDSSGSIILGGASRSTTGLGALPIGPITGTDKAIFLRGWFPEIPGPERERLTIEVVRFGMNNFLTVSGPPVCSLSERAEAAAVTNRAWDKLAILEAVGRSFVFVGNLCGPDAEADFNKLLVGVRLLK
jgi:hypothetical protein